VIRILTFLLIINALFSCSSDSSTALIECTELSLKDSRENYKIIDLRKPEKFNQGHIPKAINIWRDNIVNREKDYGGMMAEKAVIESLFGKLGIKNGDQIIIYDDKGLCDAARLWWILDYYGYLKVKLLNGGFTKWKKENHPVSLDTVVLKRTIFTFNNSTAKKRHYADIHEVKKAISDSDIVLLDTRELEEYTGDFMKKGAFRSGRIPSSTWFNWSETVDYKNSTQFKDLEKLKYMYASRGVTPDKEIIAYCQSGVRSAHTTFVLTQLLNYPNVKNYDGSWIEWSYFKDFPIEKGVNTIITKSKKSVQRIIPISKKNYWDVFAKAYKNYPKYVWSEITMSVSKWYKNYFWLLVVLSFVVWLLEVIFPWRKDQSIFRKDFLLDTFYMFFNFFLFKIIIFFAFSVVIEHWFSGVIGGIDKLVIYDTSQLHPLVQLIVFFVALDFVQWTTHVVLHRYNFLWQFHKVHHSVEQMGFAAHFRFHWMENIFYTPMKFIMMMLIGNFSPENAFVVYYITIAIGHLNHANIGLSYGVFKYIINNPKMHIWHHAHELPAERKNGVNFGISLSIWDYIFKTAYIPYSGRDIKIGFEGIKVFPKSFFKQLLYGFYK